MTSIVNHIAADLQYQGLARKAGSMALAAKLLEKSPELAVEDYVSHRTTTRELSAAVAAAYNA
jgi:hypothetical protein